MPRLPEASSFALMLEVPLVVVKKFNEPSCDPDVASSAVVLIRAYSRPAVAEAVEPP